MGIYRILNLINNKQYIGSSSRMDTRETEHFRALLLGTHHNKHLQHAYNKYGKENFKFEILELVEDREKLLEREQAWIDQSDFETLYNIGPVAAGPALFGDKNHFFGKKHSEETKAKMREAKLGHKPWNTGKREGKGTTALWRYKKADGLVISKPKGYRQERLCKCGQPVKEQTGKDGSFKGYYRTCGASECRKHFHTEETKCKISRKKRGLNQETQ